MVPANLGVAIELEPSQGLGDIARQSRQGFLVERLRRRVAEARAGAGDVAELAAVEAREAQRRRRGALAGAANLGRLYAGADVERCELAPRFGGDVEAVAVAEAAYDAALVALAAAPSAESASQRPTGAPRRPLD